jgi:fibro-slime domain-containing protein
MKCFSFGQFLSNTLLIASAVFHLLSIESSAQNFPDTLSMDVTFYDFHADKSNPEFEPEHNGGLHRNMVSTTLSPDRKPAIGSSPFFSHYIDKWFKPWTPGDYTRPIYTDRDGKFGGIDTVDHDTSFKNIVIQKTLPFVHKGNGVYLFERTGQNGTSEFFWIDNTGFGVEPAGKGHNYSFTMELHTVFTYRSGLNFEFLGDDDVWAFINDKLALDLGGMHGAEAGSINLDNSASELGLVAGKQYSFDFFYAERHTTNSRIKITTNLFTQPSTLRLYDKPGAPDVNGNTPLKALDTIPVGSLYTIYAHAFDSIKWRPEWDSHVTWQVQDPSQKITINSQNGGVLSILPNGGSGSITITARFVNPDVPNAEPVITSLQLFISAGKDDPATIKPSTAITRDSDGNGYIDRIELTYDSTVTLVKNPEEKITVRSNGITFKVDSIYSPNGTTSGKTFHIILSEQRGNELQTDWTPSLTISAFENTRSVNSVTASDGAGPVVNKVYYYPGVGTTADTLRVTISELITWPPNPDANQIFRYYQGTSTRSNAFTSISIIDDSTATLIVSSTIDINVQKDSLQLTPSGGVTDRLLIKPHQNGRKAPVQWGTLSITYSPSSNPFTPDTPIPATIRDFYRNVLDKTDKSTNTGVIIGVHVKGKPLITQPGSRDDSYGKVYIYDPTGNIINQLSMYKAMGSNDYGIYWDGKNKNGRIVGRGSAYLFVVVSTDADNITRQGRLKVGVKY